MRYEDLSAEEQRDVDVIQAELAAGQAEQEARKALRDARLEDVPANENSIPALRDKVNMILAHLKM